jgi:uncharacterized protein (DUF1778 family)
MTAKPRTERLNVRFSGEEIDYLKHAASLNRQSVAEFVRKAINTELRKRGVDAVLMREKDDA